MIETSSLDLYQYFSHTLNRGEMPAGELFQMLHLITTCESVQMSFAFLFMHCLCLFLNHLTHSPLCKCCMYISLSICLSSALQFGESAVGWMRLRCLPLMPEEEALDGAQLRWERVWTCSRNPCSNSLLSLQAVSAPVWLSKCQGRRGQKSYCSLVAHFMERLFWEEKVLLTVK